MKKKVFWRKKLKLDTEIDNAEGRREVRYDHKLSTSCFLGVEFKGKTLILD